MPRIFSTPARRDGILLVAVGLFLWYFCGQLGLMSRVLSFAAQHPELNLESLLLAGLLTGALGFFYAGVATATFGKRYG